MCNTTILGFNDEKFPVLEFDVSEYITKVALNSKQIDLSGVISDETTHPQHQWTNYLRFDFSRIVLRCLQSASLPVIG